jgi:hypothetical protein
MDTSNVEQTNLDIYGSKPIPWTRALEELEAVAKTPVDARPPRSFWLATTRPDGRPHIAGVGALWVDGKFYFTSGDGTRKSRNLVANPNCVISVSLSSLDLVVEGTARVVTDDATLERLAELYAAQGWPAKASNGAITADFSAPSAGSPPWRLYEMIPRTAFGVATAEPNGATRWRFAP